MPTINQHHHHQHQFNVHVTMLGMSWTVSPKMCELLERMFYGWVPFLTPNPPTLEGIIKKTMILHAFAMR